MRALRLILLCSLGLSLFVWGCSDDESPKTGTLTGKVIFHGQWPDSGTVQLSIFNNWNTNPCSWCGVAPGGPPAYYTPAFTNPDPQNLTATDTVNFLISGITLGTYRSVAVGWRAPQIADINCDEPTIGLWGADHNTTDSIPEPIVFSDAQPNQNIEVHAWLDMLPVPGCHDRGRIEGVARVNGTWPAEGLLVMLTTFPVAGAGPAAWYPIVGQPSAYHIMETMADTVFRFLPPMGQTYYLSIWSNTPPPAPAQWYGSFGINTLVGPGHPVATDARPDGMQLTVQNPAFDDLMISAATPAPHWISGHVAFSGTRPAEGLLVMLTSTPVSPAVPPQSQPLGYFALANPEETVWAITSVPEGTWYASVWNNSQTNSICYGAYGYDPADGDSLPDGIVISADFWGRNNIDISAP